MANNYTFDFNSAIQAGYTPDQINQYLAAQRKGGNNYQLTNTPQATPAQSQQPVKPNDNFIVNNLPTIGAVAGSFIDPLGGTAIGAGLGEAGKELLQKQPLNAGNIGEQAGLGLLGGVGGKVIGAVAGKVLPAAAEGTASRIMNSVYKEPIKATKAAVSSGQTLGEEALARGQKGTTQQLYNTAVNQINNTENTLKQTLMNSDVKVSMDDVRKTAQPLIDKYTQAGNAPAAKMLQDRLDAIEAANGSNMPAAAANQVKRALYDELQNSYGAQASPGTEGVKAIARGIKEQIGNVPGVDQLNKDLSFYGRQRNAMLDKMTRDQRNNVLGLTDALTGGTVLGGGAGIVPAAGAIAVKKALGSTAGKTVAAQAINALPKSPALAFAGNVAAQTAGQGAARTLLPMQPTSQTQESQSNTNSNQNMLPPTPSQASSNSTIFGSNSQALPATPGEAFGKTGTTTPTNPLNGYTINGKAIDPATANMIYKVATYQIDPTKITSLKNDERQRLVSLASQFDPTYDSSSFPAKAAVIKDFTSGKSAQNVRSLNTAIAHLSALADAGGALGNTSFTPYNQVKNSISQTTGQPQVTRFNDSLNAVAGEMATVFKGTSGTDEEIKSWKDQMGAAQSPEQIQAGINQMIELMSGRLQALNSQYQTGRGKPPAVPFLNPNSQRILQNFGIDPSTLTNPDALPATP